MSVSFFLTNTLAYVLGPEGLPSFPNNFLKASRYPSSHPFPPLLLLKWQSRKCLFLEFVSMPQPTEAELRPLDGRTNLTCGGIWCSNDKPDRRCYWKNRLAGKIWLRTAQTIPQWWSALGELSSFGTGCYHMDTTLAPYLPQLSHVFPIVKVVWVTSAGKVLPTTLCSPTILS